jgi:hypothetical protein
LEFISTGFGQSNFSKSKKSATKYTYAIFDNNTKLSLLNNLQGYGFDTINYYHNYLSVYVSS